MERNPEPPDRLWTVPGSGPALSMTSNRDTEPPIDAAGEPDRGVQWMLAFQAGDERGFDRIVEDYSGRVYSLLTRFLGPVTGREDLVQEVFLRVLRARERYTPTARFSTWLYRIAFNLSANERERRSHRAHLSLDGPRCADDGRGGRGAREMPDEGAPDPARELEAQDTVTAVRAAIAALPDNQRLALILARYEELSLAEIAQVMDSTEKAIKSLVHRARTSLREQLESFMQEELA